MQDTWLKQRKFRPAYFTLLFIACVVICLFALRHNYSHMVELRNDVYAADKSGVGVETALQNLRGYVTTHMNTSLSSSTGINPPIQLKYTYQREAKKLANRPSHNKFYTDAQNFCQQKYPVESSLFVWQSYVSCVRSYLENHHVNISLNNLTLPPALYEFDFASPAWSPDLAGWSLLAATLFLLLAIISFFGDFWVRRKKLP